MGLNSFSIVFIFSKDYLKDVISFFIISSLNFIAFYKS